jgi:MFS family permease
MSADVTLSGPMSNVDGARVVLADSGEGATAYLLGVPLVAAVVPMIGDRTGRLVLLLDLIGAAVMGAWSLLLALGIGCAFLPSALLLFGAAITGARRRRDGPPAAPRS